MPLYRRCESSPIISTDKQVRSDYSLAYLGLANEKYKSVVEYFFTVSFVKLRGMLIHVYVL